MNNYNDLMNEDKWNNVQNKQQQKKIIKKKTQPINIWSLRADLLPVANKVLLSETTVSHSSQDVNIFFGLLRCIQQ